MFGRKLQYLDVDEEIHFENILHVWYGGLMRGHMGFRFVISEGFRPTQRVGGHRRIGGHQRVGGIRGFRPNGESVVTGESAVSEVFAPFGEVSLHS